MAILTLAREIALATSSMPMPRKARAFGSTWMRTTPENPPVMENYSSMKNFVSVAIDPRNPDIVYAGTKHLAWKMTM